jgi:hypothetical protein
LSERRTLCRNVATSFFSAALPNGCRCTGNHKLFRKTGLPPLGHEDSFDITERKDLQGKTIKIYLPAEPAQTRLKKWIQSQPREEPALLQFYS